MIDCAFFGFLANDAEPHTSRAGKQWVRLRVGVGKDDDLQWGTMAAFGKAAEVAAKLRKGDRIYCEGTIKLDTWTDKDGTQRQSLSVASFKVDKTHNIGRARERSEGAGKARAPAPAGGDFHSDPIPEWER